MLNLSNVYVRQLCVLCTAFYRSCSRNWLRELSVTDCHKTRAAAGAIEPGQTYRTCLVVNQSRDSGIRCYVCLNSADAFHFTSNAYGLLPGMEKAAFPQLPLYFCSTHKTHQPVIPSTHVDLPFHRPRRPGTERNGDACSPRLSPWAGRPALQNTGRRSANSTFPPRRITTLL